jgi:hypothetical protein
MGINDNILLAIEKTPAVILKDYYRLQVEKKQQTLSDLKKRIYLLGTIRLVIVICTIGLAYFIRAQGTLAISIIACSGFIIFLGLLLIYNKLQKKKNYLEISVTCDENEIKAIDYDFSAFDGAPEKINPAHAFSLDLDIFGNHSLFQSINQTCTAYGKQVLINRFENPFQSPEKIKSTQESIAEISQNPDFIHYFQVTGLSCPSKDSDLKEIASFMAEPPVIRSKNFWKILRYVFLLFWVIVAVLAITGMISVFEFILFYLLTLAVSESRTKKINDLQSQVGKKVEIFNTYSELIEIIEKSNFESELLREFHSRFIKQGEKASGYIRRLAQLSAELEQRSNFMVHVFLNPLLLWDISKAIAIKN